MDRLASITAFVRVADRGGFTAAARRLDLSTTTVSDQIQALEHALGVRLLNRTTQQVTLTEIGREYYERCAQILHELKEADEAAGALQDAAGPATRLLPQGSWSVHCTGRDELPVPVFGSLNGFARWRRDDRPRSGEV